MSQFKQLSIKSVAKHFILALLLLVSFNTLPSLIKAETIGVGVGTGRIVLDEPVKPSLTYELPTIAVFNNGDVESEYQMTVQYNEVQDELKPPASWITFSPTTFFLEPGKAQQVEITLQPEYNAKPGKYFAYLEASPLKKDETGQSSVSVAAATKFHFEVIPANFIMRIYYALLAFWVTYKIYIIPILIILAIILLVLLIKKYLNIEVKRKKQEKPAKDSKE